MVLRRNKTTGENDAPSLQSEMPIIRTKLHRPPVGAQIVCRQRLHERMDSGLQRPLTVVSAPAGYGKSTLVSQWVESLDRPCAWLSLDTAENDLNDFLEYVLAAVRKCFPDACTQTEAVISSPNPSSISMLGACILNDLDAIGEDFILVLDDYHSIERASDVHNLLSFILDHPPRSLNIVIVTRRDPPLRMSSLRGKNLVTEIRLEDLRFTKSESTEMLAWAVNQPLSTSGIANLDRQIEGWAAGLHLVGLALRHTEDPDSFLENLHGGLPHTQEYLIHEVLARQIPSVRKRLLEVSILDRFCPKIFEAVCSAESSSEEDRHSGRDFIDLLLKNNLFTIPLDVQGEWFRFHHLFQEILNDELKQHREPTEIATLHRCASAWFESQKLITESIRHALSAGDTVRAAEIVERNRREAFNADRWIIVERWLAMLPKDLRLKRPLLILAEGWIAYIRLQLTKFPEIIEQCEAATGGQRLDPPLSGELLFFRGSLAYWMGDAENSRQLLDESLLQTSGQRDFIDGEMELALALARCMVGDDEAAVRTLEERILEAAPSEFGYLVKLRGALLLIHLLCGDLDPAYAEARRFRSVASASHLQNHMAWGDYLEGWVHLAKHNVDSASRHFARAADRRYVLDTRAALDALSGLALSQHFLQQPDAARESVGRLQQFANELNEPEYFLVADSCAARLACLQGDTVAAGRWARSVSTEPDLGSLFMWLETPSITQARALIAAGSKQNLKEAADALGALRQSCEGWRFQCHVIEIAVLQALVIEKQGRSGDADRALSEAVSLARPGGWVRPFVEAGPEMAAMLERQVPSGVEAEFIRSVLAGFGNSDAVTPKERPPAPTTALAVVDTAESSTPSLRPALDTLTDRELDILELLRERLYNKEIAARLNISTHTVNYHLKNVYSKLGVTSRRQAVNHAIETGILKTAT